MKTLPNKSGRFTALKNLAITATLVLCNVNVAQALPVYEYQNFPAPGKIMNDYKVRWDTNNNVMSLTSSWDVSAGIDRIAFLITDGGSPYLTPTEQFLWHDLNLNTQELTVSNYFGPRSPLQVFNSGLNITANSIDLSLDHTYLNSLTVADFPGYSAYNGMGFSNDIGIWYYMYSGGRLVETLDVHHSTPTQVPEPNIIWLFAAGLLAVGGARKLTGRS